MKSSTFREMMIKHGKTSSGIALHKLNKSGIPIEHLMVNDWATSYPPKIFVEIPYGAKKGRQSKEMKRFQKRDILSAIKFYKKNI